MLTIPRKISCSESVNRVLLEGERHTQVRAESPDLSTTRTLIVIREQVEQRALNGPLKQRLEGWCSSRNPRLNPGNCVSRRPHERA